VRYYPVFLDLAGEPCIVLGEDHLADEKAALLTEAGARVRRIAARDYRRGDLAGARLVVDASGDPEVNRQAWEEAEAAGILINVLDRPDQCRFIAPAIVRRDPVVIAISTSGESPFLASQLRLRIERLLGREWGPFTALVGRVRRRLREQGVSIKEQTAVYRRLLQSEARSLIASGSTSDAQALAATLAQRTSGSRGRVALVGAGPGDPGLLTLKARELLFDADYVLHDALVAPETLALCGPDTRLEPVGKRGFAESFTQEAINSRLIELARAGHLVVRLKGGDPFVFGRGGEELQELTQSGIDVMVVPGVTSALAAPAALGIPATLRGVSSSLAITTAQGGDSLDGLADLARASDTLVVLMARTNLEQVTAAVAAAVGGSRPAAIVSNATLAGQRHVVGTVADIARLADAEGLEAPATLIVGEVVAAMPAAAVTGTEQAEAL
jgi:uroporphyrin-III C-methyltransferase/precorrin-2 dehydrogenase/sirohydrochlorin ferrochelatase